MIGDGRTGEQSLCAHVCGALKKGSASRARRCASATSAVQGCDSACAGQIGVDDTAARGVQTCLQCASLASGDTHAAILLQ